MRTMFFGLGFFGFAAATIAPLQTLAAAPAQPQRCTAFVASPWQNGPTPTLMIEAFSDGPTCAKAVVIYVVRSGTGDVLFRSAHSVQDVATLEGAQTQRQMRTAMRAWIRTTGSAFPNASLPNWLAGKDQPEPREFGLMLHEDITREDYLAIRSSRSPILCYVQGMESLNCLVWRRGSLDPLGIQLFPG